jgi:thiosulfate/3-mercaptopyruvate sulfurtransferase
VRSGKNLEPADPQEMRVAPYGNPTNIHWRQRVMNRSKKLLAGGAIAVAFGACLLVSAQAADYGNPHLLISSATLNEMLDRDDVRVIDVRPMKDYEAGHIPKALSIPADSVNDPSAHVDGARLLDDKLAELFGSRGIDKNTHVVLYDDKGGFHAARLFWMLEYFGQRKVGILNGGIQKWTADGHKLSHDTVTARTAQFTPTLMDRRAASADWLLDRRDDPNVVVIDVRPASLFQKGHIPWARNIPWAMNLAADGTMKSADELRAHFASHGVTPDKNIASHCQDGKASAHSYFTLRLLGYPRLRSYDRSWAEWGAAADLPKTIPVPRG